MAADENVPRYIVQICQVKAHIIFLTTNIEVALGNMHQFHCVDIYSCSGDQTLKNCSNARPDLVHKMLGIAIEYFNQKYDLETAYSLAKERLPPMMLSNVAKMFYSIGP